jgi:anti-sigma regulatory factor (Ser/Thr protein kinase)
MKRAASLNYAMVGQDPSPSFPRRLSVDNAYALAQGTWAAQADRASCFELDGTPMAAGEARRLVEFQLEGVLAGLRMRDVLLLVTELVTNAIRHGEGSSGVVVHFAASPQRVRVEVCDGGSGFAFSREPRPEGAIGGLGLRFLDAVSTRWGVAGDGGTCVWFELDLE